MESGSSRAVAGLFKANEIRSIVQGHYLQSSPADPTVNRVDIDSRSACSGSLFIALRGERTDGHGFLAEAVEAGAAVLLVENGSRKQFAHQVGSSRLAGVPIIAVENTLTALQLLAAEWVARHPNLKKVAITGSNGKTTTKEMIAAILQQCGRTVRSPGNFNSEIGLPLSLFSIGEDDEYGIFEMGIDHVGEMDSHISIYRPDYSIMTNIGAAHIGKLGNLETIAREKSKIFHSGVTHGYIHEGNIWKGYLRDLRGVEFREFGRAGTEGFRGADNMGLDGWRIRYEDRAFNLRHVGIHNLLNALAAISLARDLGAEPRQIADGLASLEPMQGRSRIVHGGVTVIDDCYNANLESTSQILQYMQDLPWKGRKAIVAGSMKELGNVSVTSHETVGRKIQRIAPEAAFFFGKEMYQAYRSVRAAASVNRLFYTDSFEELDRAVSGFVDDGDLLLLKGSRAMGLERLMESLGMAS